MSEREGGRERGRGGGGKGDRGGRGREKGEKGRKRVRGGRKSCKHMHGDTKQSSLHEKHIPYGIKTHTSHGHH